MKWRLTLADPARLKVWMLALWKLLRHPQTPRPLRWLAIGILAYALSPIDLIPDFIPVLGLLDDLLLVPLGLALVAWLAPPALWQQCLKAAEHDAERLPHWRWGMAIVIGVWLVMLAAASWGIIAWFQAAD